MTTKTAEAHLVQYIDRVVDVPVDKELGGAEDAGSCRTKCYSDVEPITDIPPDSAATIAVQTKTTENLADESFYFSGEAASGSPDDASGGHGSRCWTVPSTWTFRTRTP